MDRGDRRGDEGFTLLELMVVVLIIAVLLGIAIPTFLGARDKSNDRVVASNVRTAFAAVRVFYADERRYSDNPLEMREIEPSLAWTNTALDATAEPTTIYVEVVDVPTVGQTVIVVGRSETGKCYFLRDEMAGSNAATHYQAQVPSGATCTVPASNDPSWADSWSA